LVQWLQLKTSCLEKRQQSRLTIAGLLESIFLDLFEAAAKALGIYKLGYARVEISYAQPN
jgi:hypothetical protein